MRDARPNRLCRHSCPPPPSCPAACSAECKALAPVDNPTKRLTDSANILQCLQSTGCHCARLQAGTFEIDTPLAVTKNQNNDFIGLMLIGQGRGRTTLRAGAGSCSVVNWVRTNAPDAPSLISDLVIDLSACPKNSSEFAIALNNTAGSTAPGVATATVRNVTIRGSLANQGGGAAGGIAVDSIPRVVLTNNQILDLGYRIASGTSNGTGGIRVNNSQAQIECNQMSNVSFALELSNGPQERDASGSTIANNRIVGASNVSGCIEGSTNNCSQGRGIKLQACGEVPFAPLRGLRVSGNCASQFGGRSGGDRSRGDGSGLDLVCGVQYGTFTDNVFESGSSGAQYGLQVRGSTPLLVNGQFVQSKTSPSHHNRFVNNRFSAGRNGSSLCTDCFDVQMIEDTSEQDGVGVRGLTNGNLANGGTCGSNCRFAGNRPCGDPPQAAFALPGGASSVSLGQSITLTAAGVRSGSAVTYRFRNLSGGPDPQPARVNAVGGCRPSSPFVIDATKGFQAGSSYRVTAEYLDGDAIAFQPATNPCTTGPNRDICIVDDFGAGLGTLNVAAGGGGGDPLSVRVLTPNGGESFQAGQTVNITWTVSGAASQSVLFTQNGVSFTPIQSGLPGTQTALSWTIPATLSGQAKIRIVAQNAAGASVQDDSDAFFTIQAPPPAGPAVQVTFPNGGETLQAGQTVNITWTVSGATSQSVLFTQNGVSFTPIQSGLPGTQTALSWTIPATLSGQAKIRIVAQNAAGASAQDDSDAFFTIQAPPPAGPAVRVTFPNGGETFSAGQMITITWTVSGAISQRVQFSQDGVNYTPIQTGLPATQTALAWTIPASLTGPVKVRVVAQTASGVNVQDDGDGFSNVQAPPPTGPAVRVTFPNGGETFSAGQTITITWTVSGATSQRVQYTLDGTNYTPIQTGLPATQTSLPWKIPGALSGTSVKIRVVAQTASGVNVQDESDGFVNIF